MRHLFFLFALLTVFYSCKKKELPSPTAEPAFQFVGTFGTQSLVYFGGINHNYMQTNYYLDNQSLMTLVGGFVNDSCITCEPELKFEVKDVAVSGTGTNLSGTIYDLLNGASNSKSFSLDSVVTNSTNETFHFSPGVSSGTNQNFTWNFGDGTPQVQMMNPSHVFTGVGVKSVTLYSALNGVTDTISIPIDVTPGSTCRVKFTAVTDSNLNAIVDADLGYTSYVWDFGNGANGTGANYTYGYSNPVSTKYTITLTATRNGCTSMYKRHVGFNVLAYYLANINYTVDSTVTTTLSPRINASAIVITYTKNGSIYKSYKTNTSANQSNNISFTYLGFENYANNVNGQKVVKIKGNVDAYLYNVANNNDSLRLVSSKLSVGFAYPN